MKSDIVKEENEYTKKMSVLLSDQLKNEYKAFYLYTACAAYFDRRDAEFKGLTKFYKKMAREELDHADGIIEFMNRRGYTVLFSGVDPVDIKNSSVSDLIRISVDFEDEVLRCITAIYKEAEKANDYSTTTFLDDYVKEQVSSIKELNGYYVNAVRCEDSQHGIFIFDQSFLKNKKRKE